MTAITVTDLDNAKLDVDHIAEIANSTGLTATDRIGNVKDTITGAVYKITAFTNRGAWAATTVYAVKDLVSNAGSWYVAVVAHTSSAAFATDTATKWRLYQGVTTGDLSASSGSSIVGFLQAGTGGVARTAQDKLRESLSVTDFYANGVSGVAVDPTGVVDSTLGIQAAINAGSSATEGTARTIFLPAGTYKITSSLSIPHEFVRIIGDGMWSTKISFAGVAGSAITTASMTYLRPFLENFSIVGDSSSGKGIDFSNISTSVYLGALKNLNLKAGGNAFNSIGASGSNFFSMEMDNVSAYSYNGHCFLASCGPGVSWRNCYALTAGAGKAGYRLAGIISMYSCNGVNASDYWGVFGNDLSSADGFQTDFPGADIPDITLIGCNVEEFGSLTTNGVGIQVQSAYQRFLFEGGKIDRNNLSTAYKAIFRFRYGPNGGSHPVQLNPGAVFLGAGTPSLAHLYVDTGAIIEDVRGIFISLGINTFKQSGLAYPLLSTGTTGDVYQDTTYVPNAMSPKRLTVQTLRYKTATITTINADENSPALNVTGYTKIVLLPASASKVSRFTFDQVPGTGDDYGRNGDLVIEAGNANTTLYHNYGAANGIRLKAGANKVMALGEIVRLMWSSNYLSATPGWVEV